jgi:hypothetical protein
MEALINMLRYEYDDMKPSQIRTMMTKVLMTDLTFKMGVDVPQWYDAAYIELRRADIKSVWTAKVYGVDVDVEVYDGISSGHFDTCEIPPEDMSAEMKKTVTDVVQIFNNLS